MDADGKPQHAGDMRQQIGLTLDNLEAVLNEAKMRLKDITSLNIYTTDMDETMKNFEILGARLGAASAAPPMTLLGVTRLALPELMFELEITAAN